jgi:hypothetical protein
LVELCEGPAEPASSASAESAQPSSACCDEFAFF